MIRAIVYALIAIFLITFVRMVIGIIVRGFSDLMKAESAASGHGPAHAKDSAPTSGHLKACHRCGTYVLETAALTTIEHGEKVYYCSTKCRGST